MSDADDGALVRQGAILVKWGFERYRAAFRRTTRTSQRHFEAADWPGVQRDMLERLKLYSGVVRQVVAALERIFGAAGRDEVLWSAMKVEFSALMSGRVDLELAETFYNSVTRTVFTTLSVDEDREFVHLEGDLVGTFAGLSPVRTYPGSLGGGPGAFTAGTVGHQILDDYAFSVPYADYHGDAKLITLEIEKAVSAAWPFAPEAFDFVEMLEPVFFRGKGAYLVGRVVRGRRTLPLIVALLNRDDRIWVDAALLTEAEASVVFSFTRSYFHVDVEAPAGMIQFLKGLLPRKPVAELYISLGYDKHGKTELYRDLLRFLSRSGERFEVARGERGLVMLVFTMPGYDVVFKVIRDVFGITKTVTRAHVLDRYRFVFEHDRAGRLVDTQQFEHLRFHRDRFGPGLLDELLAGAAQTVELDGDQVVLHHVYTERRVTPLNLYIREAPEDAVREAVLDFGKALRDLAATNIFPGDMLLKNFGITRSGRVVFYDYDELCLLGDVVFRELPDVGDDDERAGEASFYVGPRDVFPQEFINFFGFPRTQRELFVRVHCDLLTAAFWNRMKERHLRGEIIDVFPYKPARRLHGRHPSSEDFPLHGPVVLPPPKARD
jgi:isocitrate dehydrogenase kinase/phosphatase